MAADVELTRNDRAFAAVAIAPVWIGLAGSVLLVGLYLALMASTGHLEQYRGQALALWEIRDARFGILFAMLAAYLPVARRYATLGALSNTEALAATLGTRAPLPRSERRGRLAGLAGLLLVPVVALGIDLEPTLYFKTGYWVAPRIWTWVVGAIVGWQLSRFIREQLDDGRHFVVLADRLDHVDLFDLSSLRPFSRQAQRVGLLWVIFVSLFAINLVDRGALAGVLGLLAAVAAVAAVALWLPVRGARDRVVRAKQDELRRIAAALRAEPQALRGSPLQDRADTLSLADLLTYREFVAQISEWPFDSRVRLRLLLYMTIPLGSWLGGALVERLLDHTLG